MYIYYIKLYYIVYYIHSVEFYTFTLLKYIKICNIATSVVYYLLSLDKVFHENDIFMKHK